MNLTVEKIEKDFIALQNDLTQTKAFFSGLWVPSLVTLPRRDIVALIQKIYKWAEPNRELHPQIFAMATFSLGFINFHSENYDEALKYAAEAQKLFSEINDADGIAVCNSSFAGTYRALGNHDLALKYLLEASHQLNQTHAYPVFENICSYGLASLYLDLKRYEKSIEAYRSCIEISIKYQNRNFEMLSYCSTGEAYHHLGQDETAIEFFDKALKIGKELGNQNFYSRVLSDKASFHYDRNEPDLAAVYNNEALALREELNLIGGTITNLLLQARIKVKKQMPEQAIDTLNKAMEIAEKLQVKPKIFQIHLMLSEIYESLNEPKISLRHYKIYQQISEEVYREDGEKKLRRSEMIFEAEQTKKENVIIKNQKLQIEKANIELQKTIDELSLSKINRKAKTITLTIAILLFIIEDSIIHYVIAPYTHDNFLISLTANFSVVFLIKPIERVVEHYLLHRLILRKKEYEVVSN